MEQTLKITLSERRRLGTFRLGEEAAHQIQSGFWNVYEPSVSALQGQFEDIWDGEGGDVAACDRIFFAFTASPNGAWGHQLDEPPDPETSTWWNPTGPDATTRRENAWREANTWVGRATSEPSSYGPETCALSKSRRSTLTPVPSVRCAE